LGVVQATCLYETCFAFLTRRLGDDARLAITRVTLVAGFSGTVTFPLGALMAHHFGAQGALIGFGLLILLGAVPVNAWAVRALRKMERAEAPRRSPPEPGALHDALRRPAFWGISAIFALVWLNHGILLTFILMLFQDRGASVAMATIAAACIGPSQVAGRAGRHHLQGKVFVQTLNPNHYAIQSVYHDYDWFYHQEMKYRKLAGYVPYFYVELLLLQGNDIKVLFHEADKIKGWLKKQLSSQAILLGPTVPTISRIKTKYRVQLVIKYKRDSGLLGMYETLLGLVSDEVEVTIDRTPSYIG
jgi:uncharacterized membrane protein